MTKKRKEALATPSGKETSPRGQLATGITIGVLIGVLLPSLMAFLPITRANIVEVEGIPSEMATGPDLEFVGNDLVSIQSFTKTFRNRGLTTGRIDRVEAVVVGSEAGTANIHIRYFDRGPIRGLQSRDVRVEYVVRIPDQRTAAGTQWATWYLYFYDESGNEVGWQGQNHAFGRGDIPDEPFPPDSLRP